MGEIAFSFSAALVFGALVCVVIFLFARRIIGGGVAKMLIAVMIWFDASYYGPLIYSVMIAAFVPLGLSKARLLAQLPAAREDQALSFGMGIVLGTFVPVVMILNATKDFWKIFD